MCPLYTSSLAVYFSREDASLAIMVAPQLNLIVAGDITAVGTRY